jgi:ABC-type transport system involved in cytochrome bd biosynthesis fused ATPase/permease subunit
MDTIQENVEDLVTHITDYVEAQKELLVINAQEKAAAALSQTIVWVVAGSLAFFAFTFFSTALALGLGRLMNNAANGFLIVGGTYALLAIIFVAFRKSLIQDKLNNLFLTKFTATNG